MTYQQEIGSKTVTSALQNPDTKTECRKTHEASGTQNNSGTSQRSDSRIVGDLGHLGDLGESARNAIERYQQSVRCGALATPYYEL